jgi:hypothetical protein
VKVFRSILFLTGVALLLASSAPELSLGGVHVGASILDTVKELGTPDVVQTRDDGHLWQWSEKDGLDREVMTDDDLVVESVLVTRAHPMSTAQPPEAPVLGEESASAADAISAAGARPSAPASPMSASYGVWLVGPGVLVTEAENGKVARLRAFDIQQARRHGFGGTALVLPAHTAPVLERQYIPEMVPRGNGTTVVRVEIDADGKATNAHVIVPSGDSAIDRFEVDSMMRSTFRPATCSGVPCAGVYLDIGWESSA